MKKKIILVFCLVLCTNAVAEIPAKDTKNISGNYRCKGEDILNEGQFDEPTVVTKTGDTYHFVWQNKTVIFHGNGILLNNQLAIAYWVATNPSDNGIVTYQVLPNGDLSGRWAPKNSQKTGKEYCQKLS